MIIEGKEKGLEKQEGRKRKCKDRKKMSDSKKKKKDIEWFLKNQF